MEEIYQANDPPKQREVAILISDKVDFKSQLVRRDYICPFILIKEEIHQRK
jgi:hypothetical protein